MVCFIINAKVYDFKANNIAYKITNINNLEVAVANDNEKSAPNSSYESGYEMKESSYSGKIVIPEEVSYSGIIFKVTAIGESAFQDSNIENISLPKTITFIDRWAFCNCQKLHHINLPQKITTIERATFADCQQLESITIPEGVVLIKEDAFASCHRLQNIIFPSTLKNIETGAFRSCSSLEKVILPEGLQILGDPNTYDNLRGVFGYCSNLRTVILPSTLTSISSGTFSCCENLTTIICKSPQEPNFGFSTNANNIFTGSNNLSFLVVPAGSKKEYNEWPFENIIEYSEKDDLSKTGDTISYNNAIYLIITTGTKGKAYLKNLRNADINSISIPNSITSTPSTYDIIGISNNFAKYSNLREIYIAQKTPPSIDSLTFNNLTYLSGCLYVPLGCINIYKNTSGWNNFKNIIETDKKNDETILELPKCSVPTIEYKNDQIIFSSMTPNVQYQYNITDNDITSGKSNGSLKLEGKYNIFVYAYAEGYEQSEIVSATLYWLPTSDATNINNVSVRGIISSYKNGIITLSGLNERELVTFFSSDGSILGTSKAINGTVNFAVNNIKDMLIIAKFNSSSIKIAIN